jgi:antagonist of KipI
VGNPAAVAALEVTLIGPEVRAIAEVTCAVAGATFALAVGGTPVPMYTVFTFRQGETLRFGERSAGARACLAVRGGFDLPSVFGSRATSLVSRMGPFGGRALKAGDVLPIGSSAMLPPYRSVAGDSVALPLPAGGVKLRVMAGPQERCFTARAYETLFASRYIITPASNRMGYRLDGPPLEHAGGADILSDATPMGSLQVPASGQPILLMADRQTTGGYAKVAVVIGADLPLAGQLAPGDWIEFAPCTRDAAVDALRLRHRTLRGRAG